MAEVALQNISKAFASRKEMPVRAVNDFTLTVRNGEFVVLLGPSGAGKTTVLRLVAGLEEITEGTISIDGRVLNNVPPADRDIAMVFQNPALYPHMSVRENLAFPLRLRKFPKNEITQQVNSAAAMLGLSDFLERKSNTLSGGERQRVALGRAMVRKPKVFLFDEPLSNLDPAMRSQLRAEIVRLHGRLSATMIYVTHDQLEAMTMGDRIAVMKEGTIQQVGRPLELYDRPANLFVAGFIGSPRMNFFHGKLIEHGDVLAFTAAPENPELVFVLPKHASAAFLPHLNRQVVLGLRPEDLAVADGADSSFASKIELVEPTGPETFVHARAGSTKLILRVRGGSNVQACQEIRIVPALQKAHFFEPTSERRIE